jgi:hypothetical protein
MIRTIIPFFLVILLFSCYRENNAKVVQPQHLIPVDSLTEMITDLQLAEGIIVNNRTQRVNMDKNYKDSLYTLIFQHYGISADIFKENIDYYNNDPKLMEGIYDEVLASLSKMQSKIESEAQEKLEKKDIEEKEKDSLEKIN